MRFPIVFFILISIFNFKATGQEINLVKGVILDIDTQTELPYANITILHHEIGSVSNEKGIYALDISQLSENDTALFQYLGYQQKKISISELKKQSTVYLKEDIINLSEAFIFSNPPKALFIVKQIIKNKAQNYKSETSINQTFIRRRTQSDIKKIRLKYKRNSIPGLNKNLLQILEQNIPKHNTSYTDFFGNIYFVKDNNEITIKLNPLKTISLKDKPIAELDKIEETFNHLFEDTKDNEYWKIKTGIIGQTLNINNSDTINKKDSTKKETNSYQTEISYFKRSIKQRWNYSLMNDEEKWDFLYNTRKYSYTLIGGTQVKGEDVYIIDFIPKASGKYIGRLYVSIATYALIRADYKYDTGKTGTNIHLFGIGYTANNDAESIYFEKEQDTYVLKYFSQKSNNIFSFDRNISLIKKRKRFLFDKELFEMKMKFTITVATEESTEVLISRNTKITQQVFDNFKEPQFIKIILVDQFNDQLWKNYPIIEPTEAMRKYKKQP